MKRRPVAVALAMVLSMLNACTLAKVDVEVVSERTSLENQVLGTYNALDTDMLLVASVRGVDPEGNLRKAPPRSREHKDAVAAMQIQAFHADDIQAFKTLGWVGENNQGLLTPFQVDPFLADGELKAFAERFSQPEFEAIVTQVNEARQVVMRRVIDMNDTLTEANMPEVRRVFARLNAESALPGEKVEQEDGAWMTIE